MPKQLPLADLGEHHPGHEHAEGHGGEGEVEPAQPQGGQGDQRSRRRATGDGRQQDSPHRVMRASLPVPVMPKWKTTIVPMAPNDSAARLISPA